MAGVGKVATRVKLEVEKARARYGFVDVVVRTFRRFSEDDGSTLAAALTYYMFFSIFPLLLFVASVVGYLTFLSEDFRETLLRSGVEGVPLLNQILTFDTLETLRERRGTLALVGLLLALYSGSGAVVSLRHALNRINGLASEGTFLQKRLSSLRWLAVLGLAGVLSVVVSALVQTVGDLLGTSVVVGLMLSIALLSVSIAINTGIFMTAYKFLTDRVQTWRDVLIGSLIAAVSFEGLKFAGASYLGAGSSGRNATFGAFSTAAGLLVASYLLAQITLLAAEVNAVVAERAERRTSRIDDPPEAK